MGLLNLSPKYSWPVRTYRRRQVILPRWQNEVPVKPEDLWKLIVPAQKGCRVRLLTEDDALEFARVVAEFRDTFMDSKIFEKFEINMSDVTLELDGGPVFTTRFARDRYGTEKSKTTVVFLQGGYVHVARLAARALLNSNKGQEALHHGKLLRSPLVKSLTTRSVRDPTFIRRITERRISKNWMDHENLDPDFWYENFKDQLKRDLWD
jgi:hypothetical protein